MKAGSFAGRGASLRTIRILAAILLTAAGCASDKSYQIELMPAPDVYATGTVDPFHDNDDAYDAGFPRLRILYATDRNPAEDGDAFYENERGFLLRVGRAEVVAGEDDLDWEEARRISLLKNRPEDYPLKLASVEEFGVLERSVVELTDPAQVPTDVEAAGERFAEQVNATLALSRNKDVIIYVHGYKVVFDNPILVTTELWHFLGYEGVAIAFAWPSTPSRWAYISDLETAALSAHNLRVLVRFLAENTRAERIHIIGYSAGTRVVIDALDQLSLMNAEVDSEALRRELPIGRVILIGSDYDRHLFAAALMNGMLRIPRSLTIYLSETDQALGMSRWLFGRNRLGQMWKERPLAPHVEAYLEKNPSLALIDVTRAEAASAGNGHAYFRGSPWVSSDILVSLLYDVPPERRGLVRMPDAPIWAFPGDYVQRLQGLLEGNGPAP
jgi:esterase/lipase superfamily enzyme